MVFQEYKFEDLPNIMAENNRLLAAVKALLEALQSPKGEQPDVLNMQQASEMLSLSVPTLYSKISRREIPHFKKGKKIYFSRAELTTYINSGERPTKDKAKKQVIIDLAKMA